MTGGGAFTNHYYLLTTNTTMPSKVSLISDVSGDITIEGGTFTLNAQQTTIRKRLTKRDFNDLCSVLDSGMHFCGDVDMCIDQNYVVDLQLTQNVRMVSVLAYHQTIDCFQKMMIWVISSSPECKAVCCVGDILLPFL